MNIFRREIRANLRSLIVWSVIVALFVTMGVSKFSAYYNNPEMVKLLDTLPKAALDALNFNAFNLTTVSGFFGIMFNYFALLLGIAAVMWGTDIISKEERDKTVEFSLTLPVARQQIITGKALAALANCAVLLLVTWIISVASASRYHPDSSFYKFLALCMAAIFAIQLIFASIGLLLGCAMKRYKLATSTSIGVLLLSYFLSLATALNQNLDFLRFVTPFNYFDAAELLHRSAVNPITVVISIAIVAVSLGGAYYSYAKRDLYI